MHVIKFSQFMEFIQYYSCKDEFIWPNMEYYPKQATNNTVQQNTFPLADGLGLLFIKVLLGGYADKWHSLNPITDMCLIRIGEGGVVGPSP